MWSTLTAIKVMLPQVLASWLGSAAASGAALVGIIMVFSSVLPAAPPLRWFPLPKVFCRENEVLQPLDCGSCSGSSDGVPHVSCPGLDAAHGIVHGLLVWDPGGSGSPTML